MHVTYCDDFESLSAHAAALVIGEVERQPDLLLGAATGHSPSGLYRELARKAEAEPAFFTRLSVVKLDEWGGLSPGHPGSCEGYLRTRLLDPLRVPPDRYLGFDSTTTDPAAECERVRAELARRGPIDLCILGLGRNGHIGFNEPGPCLIPRCHVARLSEQTRHHAMTRTLERAPDFGLTLGLQEILASRRILLLVAGKGKRRVTTRLLTGEVTTRLPGSFLWLHGNVECLIDRAVGG